jgi:hypothetical protein
MYPRMQIAVRNEAGEACRTIGVDGMGGWLDILKWFLDRDYTDEIGPEGGIGRAVMPCSVKRCCASLRLTNMDPLHVAGRRPFLVGARDRRDLRIHDWVVVREAQSHASTSAVIN